MGAVRLLPLAETARPGVPRQAPAARQDRHGTARLVRHPVLILRDPVRRVTSVVRITVRQGIAVLPATYGTVLRVRVEPFIAPGVIRILAHSVRLVVPIRRQFVVTVPYLAKIIAVRMVCACNDATASTG